MSYDNRDSLDNQLTALHRILTRTRTSAYQGLSPREIAAILDDAEYLVVLMQNERKQGNAEYEFLQIVRQMAQSRLGLKDIAVGLKAAVADFASPILSGVVK